MATGVEKVHGQRSAEAFSRLRNDHEQFLEAYEKPTQIYRFLKARHTLKPLFLHRNLLYMHHPHRWRGKRKRRKLRVNDLIKYTQENKPDLASEIKSDNHLRISFSGLERGVDYQGLLAAASSESTNREPSLKSADSHPMEVEVLLCRFSQLSMEGMVVPPKSLPCSCSSLGKFVLDFKTSKSSAKEGVAAMEGVAAKAGLTLTIPESRLIWKGKDRTTGTQTLIFRASHYNRGLEKSAVKKKFRKPFPSVAIELNKLNHAEIARAKQQALSHSQSQTQSQTRSTQVSSAPENFKSSSSMSNYPSKNQVMAVQKPSLQQSCSQTVPSSASSVTTEPPPICNGTHSFSTAAASSPGVAQRRAKVKSRKEKKDVCVMTDLSFGTEVINNLISCSGKSPISPSLQNGRQDQHSPPLLRKGFTDKCTSPLIPKLAFRNGINGLSLQNGYPDLGEIELQIAMNRLPHPMQIKTPRMQEPESSTREMEATLEASESEECSDPLSGDQELVVSIPQSILSHSRTSSCSSISSDGLGASRRGLYRGPRRSEIQLLLDGDKPPSQRISAVDIPVFVAEDVSSRTTRSAAQTKGPWLSSTRKITPTESFNHSLSPSSPKRSTSDLPVENRKRTISESDSFCSPPPCKQPRIEADVPRSSQVPPLQTHQPQSLPLHAQVPSQQSQQPPPQQSQQPPPQHTQQPPPQQTQQPPPQQTQQPPHQALKLPPAVPATTNAVPNSAESHEKTTRTQPPTPPPTEEASVEQNNLDRILMEEDFSAELVAFDSRGSCLLKDGEYSILMQGCPKRNGDPPAPVTFAPLTWNSVFCPENQEEKESHNIMLHFSLSWSNGPPHHRLISELDTALDLQKLRDAYFPRTSPPPPSSPSLSPIPPPLSPRPLLAPLPPPSVFIEPEPMVEGETSSSGTSTQGQEEQLHEGSSDSRITTVPCNHPRPSLDKRIIFNFLYNNNSLQQTESLEDFHCPWCFRACGRLYNLLKHMSLCHPRFFFTYSPMEGGTVIDVHVNKLYDAGPSINRDPGERSNLTLVQRRKGPFKRLSHTFILVERHAEVDEEDLSEFLNDGSWKRGYNINRMYFHSRSCLPMLEDELDMDSEVEGDTLAWQKICSQKMIEEFTDVNQGEKEVMKLWNLFALENGLIADKQIPTACVKFAQQKRAEILRKGISRNFMTHLIALCDFGLISPAVIRSSMNIVLGVS